jgi:hypothetical protein
MTQTELTDCHHEEGNDRPKTSFRREAVGEERNARAGLLEDRPEDLGGEEKHQDRGEPLAVGVGPEGEEQDDGDLQREEHVDQHGMVVAEPS